MDSRIHFFSQKDVIPQKITPELLGIRGRQANEFAELGFPILPGIILDTEIASGIDIKNVKKDISDLLGKCAKLVGKGYGDADNPMLLKLIISSNMAITTFPVLHNFGLVRPALDGFAKWVGKDFAANEVLFMINGMMNIEERIKELEGKTKERDEIEAKNKIIKRLLGIQGPSNELHQKDETPMPKKKTAEEYMDEYAQYLPKSFFDDAETQLMLALTEISRLLKMDEQNNEDTAIVIQPMVYGNYGKESCSGYFFTRNVVTGEKKLQGNYYTGKFNEIGETGHEINKIDEDHLKQLEKIAGVLEDKFKEIRQVRFTVENGKLWLIEQRLVD